jgi:hypothetical protein
MMFTPLPPAVEAVSRTTFEFGRIQSNSDWILPIGACISILLLVRFVYRLDTRALGSFWGWVLTALRSIVFLGLLLLYLQPQWRAEREVVHNSRALVLIDTSSSMGLTDAESGNGNAGQPTRADRVARALADGDFLPMLRGTHDLVVLGFDQEVNRVAALDKLGSRSPAEASPDGLVDPSDDGDVGVDRDAGADAVDWQRMLAPSGPQTRLGESLMQVLHDKRTSPLAGVVVISDGGQNAGASPDIAVRAAAEAGIPVFTVGIGSTERPANVRVYRLDAPSRAFPGDPYTVTGLIQTQGGAERLGGTSVMVELLQRAGASDADDSASGTGTVVRTAQIILGGAGESVPVDFQLTPADSGVSTLCLRVRAPQGDSNRSDDFLEAEVEVVDRKDRVLLLAGGPTREYRFLRTQLYRDASMTVDVLLQTAQPGMSQEADKILDDFPITRKEMFDYDCVVAFDPDWQALAAAQIDLLETWVAEQGGGLIVVAGPVHTGEPVGGWVQDSTMGKIRALYPVEFPRRVSVWEASTRTANEPWQLDFTREGLEAEFLWLRDTQTASARAWADFRGVYSHQPIRKVKPAATVYARFSDPRSGQSGQLPPFLAVQFYGSGRVFYIGSGELWRLRGVDDGYFERLYTRLIRHVSQGRLLRQSSRGALMIGQDRYMLGNAVQIRARLTDARLKPLDEPSVALQVIQPDGVPRTIALQPDQSRVGTYAGQITVLQEGVYRLELPIPDSDDQRITRRIRVSLPDLELRNPERNELLLKRIAAGTGGRYYDDLETALKTDVPDALVRLLKDRTRTSILTAAPDRLWEQTWMEWVMYILAGLLCLEWLIRRLLKLA